RNLSHFRQPEADLVEVILRDSRPGGYRPEDYALDPVSADAVLHGLIGVLESGRYADLGLGFVPVRIARLDLLKPGGKVMSGRIRLTRRGDRSLRAGITLFDAAGEMLARLSGVEFRALRLLPPVEFDIHAFGMETVPLTAAAPAPIPADALWPTPEEDPLEEPALLLDALAQRIAMDALAAAGAPSEGRLAEALWSLLAGAGAACRDADGWRLAEGLDLPEASALIAGISAEYPSLGGECAALARLHEGLADWLTAGRCPPEEEVFGRAALAALGEGSEMLARRARGLVAPVIDALSPGPTGALPRILELCDGPPKLLPLLRRTGLRAELWALEEECPHPVPPAVAGGIGRLSAVHLAGQAPFHLVIGCGSALRPLISSTRLAALRPALATGGALLLAEQAQRPHVALLRLPGEMARRSDPDSPHPPRLQGPEGLVEAARAAGLRAPRSESLAVAGGTSLLLARPEADTARGEDGEQSAAALSDPLTGEVAAALEHCDQQVLTCLDGPLGDEGRLPHCIVVSRPGADPEQLRQHILSLTTLLKEAEAAGGRAFWLLCPGGAQAADLAPPDPAQAALWALARTAANEYPGCALRLLDPGSASPTEAARWLAGLMASAPDETELVLTADGPRALRVRLGGDGRPDPAPALRLMSDPAGGLDRLAWRRADLPDPGPGELRVRVEAVGLNYRDVMWSMGLLPEEALAGGFAGPTLGLECAGRIEAIGPGVSDLQPGQRVVSFGPSCLASHMLARADHVAPLPEGLSCEAAATLPVAFFTAWYALEHLGRLQPGEVVLVHGGAGGVGLAAIQIAQWRGARVIATAGTAVKRAYLRSLGVADVFSSRDLDFADRIPRLTGGVDLVLNALAGEAMERSLALLRPFGRFLELGKVDFYANTGIGLRPLRENVTYHGVDIDRLLAGRPALARKLFGEVMHLLAEGALSPLPLRCFEGEMAGEAFRLMQRSGHIGKVVIRPPAVPAAAGPEVPPLYRCDGESVSVIAGGGSGLGLELADRLSRNGARRLVVLGRAKGAPAALEEAMARAAERGGEIRYLRCDISRRTEVAEVLDEVRAWGPISLVVNSAMVLKDMRLADLDAEVLSRVMAAKVAGTENLDQETRGDSLRNFIVFTSMATLIGNLGQGAYVAANAWAEALVRRRRAAGLPGLAVGWGAISDAGYLTRDRETAQLLRRFGGGVDFSVRQALRALDQLMDPRQQVTRDPVIWVSPMSWGAPAQGLRLLRGPTYGVLQALGQQLGEAAEADDLRKALVALPAEAAVKRLTAFLTREIARILRVPEGSLSASRPVSDFGVDSLMGVELGLAAQQALGDDIPLMAISDAQSIAEIAARLVAHIRGESRAHALADLAAQHMRPMPTATDTAGDSTMEAAE
ncbi:MAG: SDR family NAD(P)-dependent oxidoreductase, partial [Rhodobacteraceae bacterium]|nr:SDR family NAD(P)-dependent oxidoreductase [Paracoccaceae bacterium]